MAALSDIVDTDGVTGDYASRNAAVVAEAQDLTDGDGDTWTLYHQATTGVADTTACEIAGWTTAVANWMKFIASAGHEAIKTGIDNDRYRSDTSNTDVYEDYAYFENLQFVADSSSALIRIISVGASNYIEIKDCYLKGSAGAGNEQGISCSDSDANVTLLNTIMHAIHQRCIFLTAGTMTLYNNTFRGNNNRAGIDASAGTTITVKNTAVFNTTDDFSIGGTSTLDYNASDDGDGSNPQTPSGADWDNEYLDPANGDMTAITGGNIENNGVGPSVDANVPTLDIDGTTRSGATCDIGADEIAGGVIYDMSATGEIDFEGNAVITNIGAMSSTGEIAVAGIADLQRLISLSATGEIAIEGNADIVALIGLSADGEIRVQGSAALAGIFGLSGTGEIGIQGQSVLNAIKILQAAGQLGIQGSADLTFVVLQDGTLSRIFGEIDLFKINGAADLLTISGAADKLEIGGEVDY